MPNDTDPAQDRAQNDTPPQSEEFGGGLEAQILNWIDRAPMIGDEDQDEFAAMVHDLASELDATKLGEQMFVYKVALDDWVESRESEFKAKSYFYHLRNAAEHLFRKIHPFAHSKSPSVEMDSRASAIRYVREEAYREEARNSFEKAGFPRDAAEVEARRRALDDDLRLERIASSAARRKLVNLRGFEIMRSLRKNGRD